MSEALALAEESAEPGRWTGNSLRRAIALQYAERHHEALPAYEATLSAIRREGNGVLEDYALQHFGKCLAEMDRLNRAAARLSEALELRETAGDEELVRSTREALALIEELRP